MHRRGDLSSVGNGSSLGHLSSKLKPLFNNQAIFSHGRSLILRFRKIIIIHHCIISKGDLAIFDEPLNVDRVQAKSITTFLGYYTTSIKLI